VNGDLVGGQVAIHDVRKGTADIDTDRLHTAPARMLPRLVSGC
jgi:hypothetical protein